MRRSRLACATSDDALTRGWLTSSDVGEALAHERTRLEQREAGARAAAILEEVGAKAERIVAAARATAEEETRAYVERRRREADRLVQRSLRDRWFAC